ncbi:DUF4115 domain-containing protein [Pseudodesulfovibrio sp. F-1]|uniref:DUF4115 domain-containing protein n=1 Tax=Pseudodesulfovibrio alkaliphilus TaxID=2661613 RepID=A0A7K1KQP2_9BACT|nr:helix-turn-helix domain-containing protein [Pseudodesulfovibrio alkaliphilus]MUM78413.1 DUF4115 domain-containing protein [Pseudodesulfovibrio alkaliphilus]
MNFEELGQTLREERERQGLTVAAVMEATKISRTNIEAMESGNRSMLPHPVYAKGFVKSYARFLGLDAEELGMVMDREFQDQECEPRDPGYDVSPNAEKAFLARACASPEGRRSRVVLVVALLFLFAVVGLLVFSFSAGDKGAPPQTAGTESSVVEGPDLRVDEVEMVEPEASGEGAEAEDAPASVSGRESASVANSAGSAESASGVQEGAAAGSGAAIPASAPLGGRPTDRAVESEEEGFSTSDVEAGTQKYDHVVIIRATTSKGCWIGVWQGEETNMSRDFVLREGEPLRLMFNSPRRIRIGNVAGVTVTYNGKPYPLENARGNIQTLRFGMD